MQLNTGEEITISLFQIKQIVPLNSLWDICGKPVINS